ncbi:MAG: STAS-like domain-containing protein [Candidatus Helarchaeales archaeon]
MKFSVRIIISSEHAMFRKDARKLFDYIEKCESDEIEISFMGIRTMSRAFADEYLKRKRRSKKRMVEKFILKDVYEMLRLVEKNGE